MKPVLACALLAMTLPSAAFAQVADLNVIGRITPISCTPSFTNGDTIDLGGISAGSLNKDSQTLLDHSEDVTLIVRCDADIPIGLRITDTTGSPAAGIVLPGKGDASVVQFGLGMAGAAAVGAFGMLTVEASVDGTSYPLLNRTWGNGAWGPHGDAYLLRHDYTTGRYISWGTGSTPQAGMTHTLVFRVAAAIAPAKNLDLTKEVDFKGSASFTLHYL